MEEKLRTGTQMKIRLPSDVHAHVKEMARRQERSLNGHIVFLLRQEMEKEKAPEHGLENRSDASDRAFDQLMTCVKIRPDPTNPDITRAVIAADFEEPNTLGLVRGAAFDFHVGFLLAAASQLSPLVAALLPVASPAENPSPA